MQQTIIKKKIRKRKNVDPCFDELIRPYVDFLRRIHLPSNEGCIVLEDDAQEILKDEKLMKKKSPYDGGSFMGGNKNIKTLVKMGMSEEIKNTDTFLSVLRANSRSNRISIKKFANSMKPIFHSIESLKNEKSKKYYQKIFQPFINWKTFKKHTKGMNIKDANIWLNDINMDHNALIFRVGMQNLNNPKKVDVSKKEKANLLKAVIPHVNDAISINSHKMSLRVLVEKAKKGDRDCLFKAVQVDKTILNEKWVAKQIDQGQIEGDLEFFDALGDAIKTSPLYSDIDYGELNIILSFFWRMGLSRIKHKEKIKLLKSCGVTVQPDAGGIKQHIYELKKCGLIADPYLELLKVK